jgi:protein gp37
VSATTGIEWTDSTWNPVRGCSRVSEGCRNCYAELVAARFSGPGQAYEGFATRRANGEPHWTGKVQLVRDHLADPLRWRKPRRIFVNSMSDLFHESLSAEHIAIVFGVMAAAQQHTFQVLTKRPERMKWWFEWLASQGRSEDFLVQSFAYNGGVAAHMQPYLHPIKGTLKHFPWPLPNVWLGVSCEDQGAAEDRIPLLLRTPAAVRFVSAEPLLGPIQFDICRWGKCYHAGHSGKDHQARHNDCACHLDWVIVGGESGPAARPCNIHWIYDIKNFCRSAGVACFVKQLGANAVDAEHASVWDIELKDRKGGDWLEWPENLRVREFPKVEV